MNSEQNPEENSASKSPSKGQIFISGTGTGVGKTFLSRGLAAAMRARGADVAALKPIETGCRPGPNGTFRGADAEALARACGHPEVATDPLFYRAYSPLSPAAVALRGEQEAPNLRAIELAVRAHASRHAWILVEGAGGLWVPLDLERGVEGGCIASLAATLGFPLLLVAGDQLGVLSHTIALLRSLKSEPGLLGLVLSRHPQEGSSSQGSSSQGSSSQGSSSQGSSSQDSSSQDSSSQDNLRILNALLPGLPIFVLAPLDDAPKEADPEEEDRRLGELVEASGLVDHLLAVAASGAPSGPR